MVQIKRWGAVAAIVSLLPVAALADETDYIYNDEQGTYSIVALDPETGELGVGVQSNTIAVASRTRWGKGGVAAIASQASSNPMFGEIGVELLERGFTPEEARDMMVAMDNGALRRQFAIIDINGDTAAWTSPDITDWKGHMCGTNYCVQGNTLTGPEVIEDMAMAFLESEGMPLPERLLLALEAAEAAGGDRRGTQSAGILVLEPRSIAGYGDRALDIRVDESSAPLVELRRVLEARRSQQALSGLGGLIDGGNFDEALARVDTAIELDPESARAYIAQAEIYLAMEDTAAAVEALATAIEFNPKTFNQVLRDDDMAILHEDPAFLELGDIEAFYELPESAPMGLPPIEDRM